VDEWRGGGVDTWRGYGVSVSRTVKGSAQPIAIAALKIEGWFLHWEWLGGSTNNS
jgi:hypothetical protein